jgi:hypothetical protein
MQLPKTWPKTKAFKPKKTEFPSQIPQFFLVDGGDATVAAYLGSGWVGGFFSLFFFF